LIIFKCQIINPPSSRTPNAIPDFYRYRHTKNYTLHYKCVFTPITGKSIALKISLKNKKNVEKIQEKINVWCKKIWVKKLITYDSYNIR